MGTVTHLTGSLSVQGGNGYSTEDLLNSLGIDGATFQATRDVGEVTQDGQTSRRTVAGLYSWTISAPFRFPKTSPQDGNNDSGSFITQSGSGLYLTNIREWSVTIAVPWADHTTDAATKGKIMKVAGELSMTGSFTALVDDTTALGDLDSGDTGLFKIANETTDNDSLSAAVLLNSKTVTRARGGPTSVQYGFESNGAVQWIGDAGLFGAAATLTDIPLPTDGLERVRVTHASGKWIEGDCGWAQVQIGRSVSGPITGSVQLQGSGDYYIDATS